MKKDINNIFMIFIAVIAIAAILAFMTNFNTIVSQDNYTKETTEHTHSYIITKAATCKTSGTSTCSCGATQIIPSTEHSWSTPADCTTNPICTVCFYEGDVIAGPHIGDKNGDGNCDGCGTKI
ncbi:MAG: hypothetical protein IKB02_10025 [Clostridia bacterium]|nr:hypothetical protein [Clostridia bacterium]MBR2389071.1 hypothetical protein [Clostridia bacterium]